MQASIFIVHRTDSLLLAMTRLLAEHGYLVERAETIGGIRPTVMTAARPAVLVIDEDEAGPEWRERLKLIPDDIPCVLLTWRPRTPVPPMVTPLGKPFRSGELLTMLAEKIAAQVPPKGQRGAPQGQ